MTDRELAASHGRDAANALSALALNTLVCSTVSRVALLRELEQAAYTAARAAGHYALRAQRPVPDPATP